MQTRIRIDAVENIKNLPFIQLSLIGNDPSMIVNVELSSSRDIKMQKKRIRIDAVENIKNLPFIQLSLIGNDPSMIVNV